MAVSIAKVAKLLLQVVLESIRVAVEVQGANGRVGGGDCIWKSRAIGVLVQVEENICAIDLEIASEGIRVLGLGRG